LPHGEQDIIVKGHTSAASEIQGDPWSGAIIGDRWRVLGLLGDGAMGRVYRAEHVQLGRPVAIKVMAETLLHDEAMKARFGREALVVARLQHPHVVAALDYGTYAGRPYLVMEYVDGESLERLIVRQGALGVPRALTLGLQIAHALGAAHKDGIVHRDVKPANVLLAHTELGDMAKVTDFGIAAMAQPGRKALTTVGTSLGTPGYLAPEQVFSSTVTPAADVYALGATLFEMLTGRPVFPDEDVMAVLRAHLSCEPPSPSSISAGVTPEIDQLVVSMLAKRPAERPPDGSSVARKIRALLGAAPRQPQAAKLATVCVLRWTSARSVNAGAVAGVREAVEGARGRIVNMIGAELLAQLPDVETAVSVAERLVRARPDASAAVHAQAPEGEAGDQEALLSEAIALARLTQKGEVLISSTAHDALGLGTRARLVPAGGALGAHAAGSIVYRVLRELTPEPAVPVLAVGENGGVTWTCSCGARGGLRLSGDGPLIVRCNGCSRRLELVPGVAVPTAAAEPPPLATALSKFSHHDPERALDRGLVAALSAPIDRGNFR
jgi:tRNA A-37 threonylcarbamoyl transferase component Bud32